MQQSQFFIIALLLFIFQVPGRTQEICDGNLGENIFTDGNFGTGLPNVLPTDPMIAPGYQYINNPPPGDGFYTISNNLGAWINLFATWLQIGDNSNDPLGYMMVVNADFQPGLFYEQVVDGLCENTLYVFSADAINLIQPGVQNHIRPNISFLINDVEFYTTGEIAQDAQWKTYGFTFSTGPGETSVTLSLRNNAPGGTGNDLAIDNIEFRPCGPEAFILPTQIASICEDGSPIELEATIIGDQYDNPAYQWQISLDAGNTWQNLPGANGPIYTHAILSSGFYYYRYLLANGSSNLANSKCRVISNVKVVHVVPKFYEIVDTLCEGLSFQVGTSTYDQSGVYTDSLISSIGCDSIVTLDLTIVPDQGMTAAIQVADPACVGFADGSISVDGVQNGVSPYTYFLNGEPSAIAIYRDDLPAGTYVIRVEDRYGCSLEEWVELQDPAPFFVDLGPDRQLTLGEWLRLEPNSNYEIQNLDWSPQPVACELPCLVQEWYPVESQTLFVSAISAAGCPAQDSVFIEVEKSRQVYFPNIFSPDFDGINDYFTVFGSQPNVQRIHRLLIFDRWGSLVFETGDFLPNEETAGWDGTIAGELASPGVYTYLVEVLFLDGKEELFGGDILLMR